MTGVLQLPPLLGSAVGQSAELPPPLPLLPPLPTLPPVPPPPEPVAPPEPVVLVVVAVPSLAVTTMLYVLSATASSGFSKYGELSNDTSPVLALMLKSPESVPPVIE